MTTADRLRRWYLAAAIGLTTAIGVGNLAAWLPAMVRSLRAGSVSGVTGGTDFAMFLAAADLASADRWQAVYSLDGLADFMSATFGGVSFAYPPPFAQALAPLLSATYPTALTIWLLLGAAGLIILAWSAGWRGAFGIMAMLFPIYVGLRFGQFVPIAILILAVAGLMLDRFPLTAGALIGLLILKPQFVLGILIVAIATRHRSHRFLRGAALSIGLVGLTSFVAAPNAWAEFVDGLADVANPSVSTRWDFSVMGVFGWVPGPARSVVIGAVMLSLIVVMVKLVARTEDPRQVLALGLILSLLISPRVVVYDWALLAVAFAWLAPAGSAGSVLAPIGATVALSSLLGYVDLGWLAWVALAAAVVAVARSERNPLSSHPLQPIGHT